MQTDFATSAGAAPDTAGADIEARYDGVAYPSQPQPATHPDRLAAVAILSGLEPAPVARCRYLEVGCGEGGNLLALAAALPGAEFVGFDLSGEAIAAAERLIARAGLTNARVFKGDIREVGAEAGEFDYIVAHGVYSWVPGDVRAALLRLCKVLLKPRGIAYISYGALPGGHLRTVLREMLLFHLRDIEEPLARAEEAQRFVRLLGAAPPRPGVSTGYRQLLGDFARQMAGRPAGSIFHDELAGLNDPVTFSDFMRDASRVGLQFLGESEFYEMTPEIFPAPIANSLREIPDILVREQYLDFLKGRQFRTTLLCHAGLKLERGYNPNRIARFWASTDAKPAGTEEDGRHTFRSEQNGSVTVGNPLSVAAMYELAAAYPAAIGFSALVERACARLAAEGEEAPSRYRASQGVANFLFRTYGAGVIELHTGPRHVLAAPGPLPEASAFVRAQAADPACAEVVSLRHERVLITDEAMRALLLLLDGTRDRVALLEGLTAAGHELPGEGEPAQRLEERLLALAGFGVLVA